MQVTKWVYSSRPIMIINNEFIIKKSRSKPRYNHIARRRSRVMQKISREISCFNRNITLVWWKWCNLVVVRSWPTLGKMWQNCEERELLACWTPTFMTPLNKHINVSTKQIIFTTRLFALEAAIPYLKINVLIYLGRRMSRTAMIT